MARSLYRLRERARPPQQELRTLNRNMARESERLRPDVWEALAETLDPEAIDDPYWEGYAAALQEFARLTGARKRRAQQEQSAAALAGAKTQWHPVLRLLREARQPSELATALGRERSSISRTLSRLQREGLVECLSPEQPPADGRQRWYQLTALGEQVVEHLPPPEPEEALDIKETELAYQLVQLVQERAAHFVGPLPKAGPEGHRPPSFQGARALIQEQATCVADALTRGRGDGRISQKDAEAILKIFHPALAISELSRTLWVSLEKNYRLTMPARRLLKSTL